MPEVWCCTQLIISHGLFKAIFPQQIVFQRPGSGYFNVIDQSQLTPHLIDTDKPGVTSALSQAAYEQTSFTITSLSFL